MVENQKINAQGNGGEAVSTKRVVDFMPDLSLELECAWKQLEMFFDMMAVCSQGNQSFDVEAVADMGRKWVVGTRQSIEATADREYREWRERKEQTE